MSLRKRAKCWLPSSDRKPPETLRLTHHGRLSRSAWLLSKGRSRRAGSAAPPRVAAGTSGPDYVRVSASWPERAPAGGWPLRSAPSPRDRGCRGIRHQCGFQQGIEPVFEGPHDFGGDRPILLLVAHQAQRVSQLTRPHLSVRLGQTAQFAQQMCPAQRVFRGELEIHAPGVVHQEALELWQDIHGLLLPLVALQNLPGPLASLVSRTPFQGAVPVSSRPRRLSLMRSDAWPPYSLLKGRPLRSGICPGNANRPYTLPELGRHHALT
jgi:hypothetical protein